MVKKRKKAFDTMQTMHLSVPIEAARGADQSSKKNQELDETTVWLIYSFDKSDEKTKLNTALSI